MTIIENDRGWMWTGGGHRTHMSHRTGEICDGVSKRVGSNCPLPSPFRTVCSPHAMGGGAAAARGGVKGPSGGRWRARFPRSVWARLWARRPSMKRAGASTNRGSSDLVLLDLRLGGKRTGAEVLEYLRAHRRLVPVVVITGLTAHVRDTLLGAYTVTAHSKPWHLEELVESIMAFSPQRFAAAVEHVIDRVELAPRLSEMFRTMAHGAHGHVLAHHLGIAGSLPADDAHQFPQVLRRFARGIARDDAGSLPVADAGGFFRPRPGWFTRIDGS